MWLIPRRAFLRNAPFSVSLGALDAAFSVLVEVSERYRSVGGDEGLFNGLPDMRGCQISERVLRMVNVPCFTNSGSPRNETCAEQAFTHRLSVCAAASALWKKQHF